MQEGMDEIDGNGKQRKSYIVADVNYIVRAIMVASLLEKQTFIVIIP